MATALDTLRMAELTDDELVSVMVAWRRITSWAQSCELAAVAELVRRREERHPGGPPLKVAESIADEIALALTLSGGAAGMWAGLACRLTEQLPATRQALAQGRIDLPRAKAIADGLLGVDRETAWLVEQAVIGAAERMPVARLRHRVRAAIKAVDPQAAEERRQRARKVRSLEMWATAAGTCELALREVCEEDAEAIYNRINAAAQAMKADGDARPIDAIRHDLGVALLRGTPLPEAARDLRPADAGPCTATERSTAEDRPQARPCLDPGCPAADTTADAVADTTADAVADTAAQITRMLAEVIDERLGSVAELHRATGRRTGRAPRINAAIQTMSDALSDLKHHWCRSTAPPGKNTVPPGGAAQTGETAPTAPTEPRGPTGPDHRGHPVTDQHPRDEHPRDEHRHKEQHRHDEQRHGQHHEGQHRDEQHRHGDHNDVQQPGRHQHGHHGYRPPAGMRRLVERTHRTCVFPTCDRPAAQCDLDHTLAWNRGGPTCACNLAPLCRRHHKLKQHPHWRLFQPWPGLLVWLTPAGTWHIHHPRPNRFDFP
ncbi:DUF222 domain-containing protein [Actinomadura scrupuli]|uniref:HNH endonuclease signature motif containing protein n=1 Tax=Actinomadura scrupuli TaxID=559629 RepID=UPI003D97EC3C